VVQVFDQYLSFVALEAGLFSLSMPDSYLELNDPAAQDTQIEASVSAVVDGVFSALVTLGVVPIIRCPKVGTHDSMSATPGASIGSHSSDVDQRVCAVDVC
jgi:hypothetical protein